MKSLFAVLLIVAGIAVLVAKLPNQASRPKPKTSHVTTEEPIFVPHAGAAPIDEEIRKAQMLARDPSAPLAHLEALGWKFIAKARLSNDPGYYRLAENCAQAMERRDPAYPPASLLRAHALNNMHRFREAEQIAQGLVQLREDPLDFALLGDALMEQGKLSEAAAAYQKLADLKPGFLAYSRAAHMRWLTGDVSGAREMMEKAVRACSPRDVESLAWAYSRLAFYQFQSRATAAEAEASIGMALRYHSDSAAALQLRGRMQLATGGAKGAVSTLRRVAELNPLPENQWLLADALREAGMLEEASAVEDALAGHGEANDPRGLSLYLSTRGISAGLAMRLATAELENRQDVFTRDAFAWALFRAGNLAEAREESGLALAAGTEDARILFHAAVIALSAGDAQTARPLFRKAGSLRHLLFPSERQLFEEKLALLQRSGAAYADGGAGESAIQPNNHL